MSSSIDVFMIQVQLWHIGPWEMGMILQKHYFTAGG